MVVHTNPKSEATSGRVQSLATQFHQHPLATIREEMDDLISRMVGEERWFSGRIVPFLDLSETDTTIQVEMDLPGIDPSEVDIHLSGNTLNIRGGRNTEKEDKGRRFHRIERSHGTFSRTITLSCAVEQNEVAAEYTDGVLTITLPKCEEARSRKIPVKH